jgi:hypothetical protein
MVLDMLISSFEIRHEIHVPFLHVMCHLCPLLNFSPVLDNIKEGVATS